MDSNFERMPCADCFTFQRGLCTLTEPFSSCYFHPNYSEPFEDTPYNSDFLSSSDLDVSGLPFGGDF